MKVAHAWADYNHRRFSQAAVCIHTRISAVLLGIAGRPWQDGAFSLEPYLEITHDSDPCQLFLLMAVQALMCCLFGQVNVPKTKRAFCKDKNCKKHTVHKVTQYKTGKASLYAQGQ